MAGLALTGGTSRGGAVTSGLVLTRAGTAARAPQTHASAIRVSMTHATAAVHVPVTRASAGTHARWAEPARAGVPARTRC
jgi:hypothetical protein